MGRAHIHGIPDAVSRRLKIRVIGRIPDPLTEQQVLETLFKVMKKKTSLLITHRLIGLENMDQILVMNHGHIIERGTQSELANSASFYRHLLDLQNRILLDEN